MDCEKIAQLEESYLLGELGEAEMKLVKDHLTSCQRCRQRLSEYEELLGRMFGSISPIAPAAWVKTATFDRVTALNSRPLAKAKSKSFKPSFGYLYGGLAAIIVLGLLVWQVILLGQVQNLQNQLTQNTQILSFATSANTASWTMTLPGQPYQPGQPIAKMLAHSGSNFYYVSAAQLPAVATNQVYRVWYRANNEVEFVGELQPDQKGSANLEVADPNHVAIKIKSCFITIEKVGSSDQQPSGKPFLEWDNPDSKTATLIRSRPILLS